MAITVEQPHQSGHVVQSRVVATLADGRQIALHAAGDVVSPERAEALKDHDCAALGVVDFYVEGDEKPKSDEPKRDTSSDEPRTAKRSSPGR